MSASLVGSEMCIRDRLYLLCSRAGRTISGHALGGGPTSDLGLLEGELARCLLYTSDAADDM
eukprot:10564594-Alexandrium_andersonii.AAC.1